jgi:hypothetical protein
MEKHAIDYVQKNLLLKESYFYAIHYRRIRS